MGRRSFRYDTKGQVIVVSGLLIAILLLSTAIYVIDVQKTVPTVDSAQDGLFLGYKETFRAALVSALSNASGGGSMDVLNRDLSELRAVILSHSYQSMLSIEYSTLDALPYVDGFWIYWGVSGSGVSSACASFLFASKNPSGSSNIEYTLNVTSQVQVSGGYVPQNDTQKQVDLDLNILNEGKPALAQTLSFRYLNASEWVPVDAPGIVNFGNGTYTVSFAADTLTDEPLAVSALCLDQRGIFVGANITCSRMA